MHWKGGAYPPTPPGRPAYAQPLSPWRQVPASMAFVTDSNRPQLLWQPPPTACLTASGAASEVPSLPMHPCPSSGLAEPGWCVLFGLWDRGGWARGGGGGLGLTHTEMQRGRLWMA